MCKIASEKKNIKWKKSTSVRRGKKKHVILNKILICSDTEHSKAERNKKNINKFYNEKFSLYYLPSVRSTTECLRCKNHKQKVVPAV